MLRICAILYKCVIIFILSLTLIECGTTNKTLSPELSKIIKISQSYYGGLANYNKINVISYKKDYKLYDSSGNIDAAASQKHVYNIKENTYHLESDDGKSISNYRLLNRNYEELKDGQWIPSDRANRIINAAMYVISMPWNFDKQDGQITLENSAANSILRLTYNETEGTTRTSKDKWSYYINHEGLITHQVAYPSDHISLVENLSHTIVEGIKLVSERQGYRVDSLLQKKYKRSDYKYYDYRIW